MLPLTQTLPRSLPRSPGTVEARLRRLRAHPTVLA